MTAHHVTKLLFNGTAETAQGEKLKKVLPGETIELSDEGLQRIIRPSEFRIKPVCRHSNACGGCSLQHAHQDFISEWKTDLVLSNLNSHGINAQIDAIHVSPPSSRRRCKFSAKRTKKSAIIGFFEPESHVLTQVDGCQVLVQDLIEIIPHLQEFTSQFATRRGTLEFWCLATSAGVDLTVSGIPDASDETIQLMTAWASKAGLARFSYGGAFQLTFSEPHLEFGQVSVVPPPLAFTQATLHAERKMQKFLSSELGETKRVVDLFSGVGHLGLSQVHEKSVDAYEAESDMVTAAIQGARAAGFGEKYNARVRNLFKDPVSSEELSEFPTVILNPPRSGAFAQSKEIANSDVSKVIYVSCNPNTFARDALTLVEGGYKLGRVEVIDQFRWSTHIEVLAKFERC